MKLKHIYLDADTQDQNNLEDTGAKQLWCAVINQTFEDLDTAIRKNDAYEVSTIRLTISHKWFQQICLMAGMDYMSVKRKFDGIREAA